jgi:hypothetical protein
LGLRELDTLLCEISFRNGDRNVSRWQDPGQEAGQEILKRDVAILRQIDVALGEVGRQLDAADRVGDHAPWAAIAAQEACIASLAERLSTRFRQTQGKLVRRLSASGRLHLEWGGLQDEVRQFLVSMER